MKRVFRFLHSVVLAICITLLVLVLTAWLRSRTRDEEIGWLETDIGPQVDLAWDRVGVRFEYWYWPQRMVKGQTMPLWCHGSNKQIYFRTYHGESGMGWSDRLPLLNRAGFSAVALPVDFRLLVPFWFLALLMLILPSVSAVRFARRRRAHPPGVCQNCGYDLRMTPDRCPECGVVPISRT
jgi:hypothetical protein